MRRHALLLLLVSSLCSPAPALADETEEAREAYRQGREAYKAGNYREALVYLKRAHELKPMPALLRYMGDTYYKMNKARQAITEYKKYLKEAPMAEDRAKIEERVRQLELIVGPGDDEEDDEDYSAAPPPPPPEDDPAAAPEPEPAPAVKPRPVPRPAPKPAPEAQPAPAKDPEIDMRPTGEDTEDPLIAADRRRKAAAAQRGREGGEEKGGSPAVGIGKWVALAGGVAGMAMGIAFNRLAASEASKLEDAITAGNPDKDKPTVSYSKEHHDMITKHGTYNNAAIGSFVAGGVLLGTAVALFVVDAVSGGSKKERAEARRLYLAPAAGGEYMGFAGEIQF